ncbi:unnamed protein product [Sphenostylis stenocarpa]|uniref:WD repeat-containing protein 43 n=1 Tax=Sphenostylis stenocarpa TaxID=92480 RepID=A0AA86SHR8_9FABA|nr:unnamed protein product [Sphenostylis stenocarpa]
MASTDIRGILTAFNPTLDFFAITAGDGRVKIWDTLSGQVHTEFADIASTHSTTTLQHKSINGHLALDYTCIKWFSLERKRKRKHVSSLLVLGTGSGDVLALDVAAGQLSWRITDCHPGGVRAIASSANVSSIFTAGADGMVCVIDFMTGNLLEKFKASTKAISCMCISPGRPSALKVNGKTLATAASQLKIFNCSNHKKIQKFAGHPGSVRCMVFTEDGKYIFSSAVGERYVAVWRLDGAKKQSACCVLAMEHPAVFLDSRCIDSGEHDMTSICVLAISEIGICYLWFGNSIEELRSAKATKISLSLEDMPMRNYKGALPSIYAAKLQGIQKAASGQVFLVYGLLVKPSFKKILVHSGTDVKLNVSHDGFLLPTSQALVKSRKGTNAQTVTALDRANAEDALLPIPKVFDSHEHEKEKALQKSLAKDVDDDLCRSSNDDSVVMEDDMAQSETDGLCMEDLLRSLGMLSSESDYESNIELCSKLLKGIDLEATIPAKKIRAAVLSVEPREAFILLKALLAAWESRSSSGKYILPWIYGILVNHAHNVIAEKSDTHTLDSLDKEFELFSATFQITNSRAETLQPLLQLSGRLQLVTSQIDKASQTLGHPVHELQTEESEDEEEDEYYHEGDDTSEITMCHIHGWGWILLKYGSIIVSVPVSGMVVARTESVSVVRQMVCMGDGAASGGGCWGGDSNGRLACGGSGCIASRVVAFLFGSGSVCLDGVSSILEQIVAFFFVFLIALTTCSGSAHPTICLFDLLYATLAVHSDLYLCDTRKWIMDGERVNGICLYMPRTGKEYAKGKRCGKCKESFCFSGQGERDNCYRCLIGPRKRGDDSGKNSQILRGH